MRNRRASSAPATRRTPENRELGAAHAEAWRKANAEERNHEEPSLKFIDLDVIDMLPQVRTTFDDETIAELAESIKTHGMLQPVLL